MYLIPRNISKRFEFFPGWGWKEFLVLIIGLGIGCVIALLSGLIIHSPVRFLCVLFFGGAGYMMTKPVMADGSSALDILKHMQRFRKKQKLYLYQKGGF